LGRLPTRKHAIDSTIVRAHQHAAGVKGGIRRSKLSAARAAASRPKSTSAPAKGNPLTFDLTAGEAHETQGFDALMELHDAQPAKLLGDKGYDSDAIRSDLAKRGIEPVIPPRSNRTTPIEYDREAYKRRNLIERCVNRLEQFRRIATPLRKNGQSLYLNAMHCSCKALDQNCQYSLVRCRYCSCLSQTSEKLSRYC